MTYTPYYPGGWQNDSGGGTPIIAAALQHIETELVALDAAQPTSGTPLGLSKGGTGVSAASNAALLGSLGALSASNNLSDVASASSARTSLGLGAAALIGTPVSLANGGTGQTTAVAALAALKGQYAPVSAPLPSGDTTGATDTPALNAALAALAPGEALILTVPGYYINAPLSVPAKCGLLAPFQSGTASTAHITTASGFTGGAMVANAGWLSNSTAADDGIEISGLYIDGQNGGSAGPFVSTHGHGIVLSASHSRIHHCYVKNTSGSGIVWADFNSAGSPITSGVTQENYCYDNKVSNPGQWCIWVPNTSGSLGMTDSQITRCIVTDPGYGSYYRNGNGNPQINASNNFPYEGIRLDNAAGWWVTDNHAYWCPGGAYFFSSMYSTHVLNNTSDSWGTFPWSLVGGVFTAAVIIGMALHKVKCDTNTPPNSTGRAIPSVVMGNVLNTLEGLNSNGIYAAGSGGASNGCRFTFYDITADTLTVPAGASGAGSIVFIGNQAHQNTVGGASVANCTTISGSATVTAAGGAFAGVQKGMSITGTGIPANSYVGSVTTGASDSLNLVQADQSTVQLATASGTVTLTFPAPYSLAEKWTASTASVVLNGMHSSNRSTGSVVSAPTVSTSNGAVVNLLGEIGGVTISGTPAAGQLPFATGAPTAAWRAMVAADLPTGTTSAQGALQLDGTASDITADGTQAAGATGKAADAGHVHPAGTFMPADQGFLIANFDPETAGGTKLLIAGTLYLMKMWAHAALTLADLWFSITTAGAGASTGSFVGWYSSAGTLLSGSADIGGSLTTTGPKPTALTSSQALTAGTWGWMALLVNLATTQPTVAIGGAPAATANANLATTALRFAVNGTSLTTLPSTITPSANTGTGSAGVWVAGS